MLKQNDQQLTTTKRLRRTSTAIRNMMFRSNVKKDALGELTKSITEMRAAFGREVAVHQSETTNQMLDKEIARITEPRSAEAALKPTELRDPEPLGLSKPRPPVNLRAGETTPTTVELLWDPPLYFGGSPVYDYPLWQTGDLCIHLEVKMCGCSW